MNGLPNGRDAPSGGVADGEEKPMRNHIRQEEKGEGVVSSFINKLEAFENGTDDPDHPPEKLQTANGTSSKEAAPELAAIAKDLKRIKRQNTITHVMLGAVILMTAVWQVNEVSFLLWVQRKLSNPFKSLGDAIKASLKLKRRRPAVIESSPLPPVGVPDVTRADLPSFVIGGDHR